MAKKSKRANDTATQAQRAARWATISWARSRTGYPLYIQLREDSNPPFYRAVYLIDNRLRALAFWSSDRGATVEDTADKALLLRSVHTAEIQLSSIVNEDMADKV